ncbi:lipopolysaccharide biosynthesis protein [Photobacterium leiognathi]|uniref:lipopolysaccharide biosynthesis protein n=1 Tax=Photobacterium leiognathi TaxID=553611 RepID=UPI0029819438|nr:oligosaccharide flippase family protein [Photobacterium leiognathi]
MSTLVKNTFKLLSGSLFAQIISVVTIPIITRLFGAEEFGVFAIILAISMILVPLFLLGMHLAILIPKDEVEALKLVVLGIVFSLIAFVYTCIICHFFYKEIAVLFNIKASYLMIMTLPLLTISQAILILASYWGVRNNKVTAVSYGKIGESLSDRGFSIMLGCYGYTTSIILILTKSVSGFLSSFFIFKKTPLLSSKSNLSNKSLCEAIPVYKNYIIYNTSSSLLMTVGLQVPVILIGSLFGPLFAGFFAMANRLVNIPVQALGGALSKTITKHIASEWHRDKEVAKISIVNMYNNLFSLLLLPFLLISLIGEPIIVFVLGDEWTESGNIVQILSLLSFTNLLVQALGGVFDITNKQQMRLIYHSLNSICRILSVVVPYYYGFEFKNMIIIYSVVASIMNFIALLLVFYCSECKFTTVFGDFKLIIVSVLYLSFMIIVKGLMSLELYVFTSCLIAMLLFYLFSFEKLKLMRNY